MAGMSIDGLVSGLDTTSLVNQLMQVEAIGQSQLKARVSANTTLLTALRGLNTKVTAMQTAATKLADPAAWGASKATTVGDAVLAGTATGAVPGSHTVTVSAVAAAHSVYSDRVVTDKDAPAFQIPADGITVAGTRLTPASGSLNDLVTAINAADGIGVKAYAVQTAPGQFRLQIAADLTGAASAFSADLGPGELMRTGVQGADSVLTVDGLPVTSPTATVSQVVPGLTLTVRQPGTSTVTVASDPAALADTVAALVDAANAVLTDVRTKSAYDATGRTGGPLTGNAAARDLAQSLLRAVPGALGATPVATAGVQTTRDGALVFDRAAFLAAVADDPAAVRSVLSSAAGGGLAQRLADVATGAVSTSVGREGSLVLAVTGVERRSTDLNRQIEAWDTRLELRRETLQRQFSGLEVALSRLQSQSQWLSGQLASLSTSQA